MPRVVTVPPTQEPISLDQARDHVRMTSHAEDLLIGRLIKAVREKVESDCNRYLITQTVAVYADKFPSGLFNVGFPIQSVSSVQYTDEDGNPQTMDAADYSVDNACRLARIKAKDSWPTTDVDVLNAVTVTVVAGYGDPKDVPDTLIDAMLLLLTHLFDNRGLATEQALKEVPMSYEFLIRGERVAALWQ